MNEKKVYLQILENTKNNNIIDPIEKFNSISDVNSSDNNINNANEDNENNNNISDNCNNIKINSLISGKSLVENGGFNVDKRPTLNDIDNKGNFITKHLCNSFCNENNNIYNSIQRQNESNDMLFHELNNNTNIPQKNKLNDYINFNLSDINILNKKKNDRNRNRKYTTSTNKFYDVIKAKFKFSLINKNKNKNKSKNKSKKNEATNIRTDNKANEDQKDTINNY